jgi:hypothetical protein
MKLRYLAAVSIVVAGVGLTGCSTANPPAPAATTTPALSPTEQLTAALGKLKGASYDVAVASGGGKGSGKVSVDSAKKRAAGQLTADVGGQTLSQAATQIGPDLWVKFDLGASLNARGGIDPKKWMHVDLSKLTSPTSKQFDFDGPDVLDVAGLLVKVSGVTATDATHLAGTVDLTAATGIAAPSKDDLQTAGDKARSVPFTLSLDSQGRPAQLDIKSDVEGLQQTFTYSNYGSPSPITPPAAADVIPATDVAYQILNG